MLCPNPSEGVGEHVWPSWLIDDFADEGPFTSSKGGVAYTKRDDTTVVTFSALPGVHVPMCSPCNVRLNRTIEEPAKAVAERLVPWSAEHTWPVVSATDSAALARWYLKIGLLSAHPAAVHDNPHVDRDPDMPRFDSMQPEWLAWMHDGTPPPEAFSVFVTRRAVTGEQPWAGQKAHIVLPRVRVDWRDLHYMTRSFGIRGLDIVIVWHPGWPIQHPLVATGRACRLWPAPTVVDFGALPESNPQELTFVESLGVMALTADEFARMTETPLTVGQAPMMFFGT